MKLFDLHCDTPTRIWNTGERLSANSLHVSLERAEVFDRYIQCAAYWCQKELSNGECYRLFFDAVSRFESECGGFIRTVSELEATRKTGFILTVEDARLIADDPQRLSVLYSCGVRVLTLLWAQTSAVGAAWNAEGSLTDTGREILEGCFDIGIIPDLSHGNDKVISYALERAVTRHLPIIATHSNSRTVCPHKRNLTDENASAIAESGGIIGISLYPPHLSGESADISHILRHISHYLSVAGSEAVCLGCDFDGIDFTPDGIKDISELTLLFEAVSEAFGSHTANRIFFDNAYNFFINNLPTKTKEW